MDLNEKGILTGIIADLLSINASILVIGVLTIASALIVLYRMKCKNDDSIKIWNWLTKKRTSNKLSCKQQLHCT